MNSRPYVSVLLACELLAGCISHPLPPAWQFDRTSGDPECRGLQGRFLEAGQSGESEKENSHSLSHLLPLDTSRNLIGPGPLESIGFDFVDAGQLRIQGWKQGRPVITQTLSNARYSCKDGVLSLGWSDGVNDIAIGISRVNITLNPSEHHLVAKRAESGGYLVLLVIPLAMRTTDYARFERLTLGAVTETQARVIGVAALRSRYGYAVIDALPPFKASLKDGAWQVTGQGDFLARVSPQDGAVLELSDGQ